LWRIVCLVLGVLGGHLALLWWLQSVPAPLAAVVPAIRFHLTPVALPTQPPEPRRQPSRPSTSRQKPVSSKVQASTQPTDPPPATQKDMAEAIPGALATTGLDVTEKVTTPSAMPSTQAGTSPPGLPKPAALATAVLPSRDADYLNNPAPDYPAISRRLGEQGKVVIRVLIDKDGTPQLGNIHESSGYPRLDQAALRAVMGWRYVPGQLGGTAQAMWFNVPIQFALN